MYIFQIAFAQHLTMICGWFLLSARNSVFMFLNKINPLETHIFFLARNIWSGNVFIAKYLILRIGVLKTGVIS
jgi:hypothetical protein